MTELIIEPGRAEKNYWRDLWLYRELFYFLGPWSAKRILHRPSLWRYILVRYKQTVIGVAWIMLRPLLNQKKQPHLPFGAGEPSLITQ